MNTLQFFTTAWIWNPYVVLLSVAALAGYLKAFHYTPRFWYFATALVLFLFALISPVATLADGYLFSAHMLQHMLLLLIVPALLMASLPRTFELPRLLQKVTNPVLGWLAGVGSMWMWHAPALCNAASSSKLVFAFQTASLLALGSAFWWQVIAPRDSDRLSPLMGIIYLFTACTACSALGIILTFSPVTVCAAYTQPMDRLGMLNIIRSGWGMSASKDQQVGGLLMWVPMCMIYLTAIFGQLARWFYPHEEQHAPAHATGGKH